MDAERDTTHRVSRQNLVLQDVFCFPIELVSEFVDPRDFVFRRWLRRIVKKPANRFGDESGPVMRYLIDLFGQIVRNRDLYTHITPR